jgi:hypothetical protein
MRRTDTYGAPGRLATSGTSMWMRPPNGARPGSSTPDSGISKAVGCLPATKNRSAMCPSCVGARTIVTVAVSIWAPEPSGTSASAVPYPISEFAGHPLGPRASRVAAEQVASPRPLTARPRPSGYQRSTPVSGGGTPWGPPAISKLKPTAVLWPSLSGLSEGCRRSDGATAELARPIAFASEAAPASAGRQSTANAIARRTRELTSAPRMALSRRACRSSARSRRRCDDRKCRTARRGRARVRSARCLR